MTVVNKNILISMTRLLLMGSLVFLLLLPACKNNDDKAAVIIEWEGNRASGIIIPGHLLKGVSKKETKEIVSVTRKGDTTVILGDYTVLEYETVFHPLISFTRGNTYEIRREGKVVATFTIPWPDASVKAEVVHIYPSADTLPENLLKFYIQFSLPMQEGNALDHIILIKDGTDTLKNTFLELQQELWSNDRKTLTVWFDPGRIKRDLQPNKLLGPPLEKGHHYQLIIDKGWDTGEGVAMQSSFGKKFVTTARDDASPDMTKWKIIPPAKLNMDPLAVEFEEPMNYDWGGCFSVYDSSGNYIFGRVEIGRNEKSLLFYPEARWAPGVHTIHICPQIEDVAGNSFDHLFDNDLTQPRSGKVMLTRPFTIR
jgi:hypothetical protein